VYHRHILLAHRNTTRYFFASSALIDKPEDISNLLLEESVRFSCHNANRLLRCYERKPGDKEGKHYNGSESHNISMHVDAIPIVV
jgi:hypothetical protein